MLQVSVVELSTRRRETPARVRPRARFAVWTLKERPVTPFCSIIAGHNQSGRNCSKNLALEVLRVPPTCPLKRRVPPPAAKSPARAMRCGRRRTAIANSASSRGVWSNSRPLTLIHWEYLFRKKDRGLGTWSTSVWGPDVDRCLFRRSGPDSRRRETGKDEHESGNTSAKLPTQNIDLPYESASVLLNKGFV